MAEIADITTLAILMTEYEAAQGNNQDDGEHEHG